jgi:hypothetical protein
MPALRYRPVERHKRSSAFWGVAMVFAVVMLGLVAYGYHGIRTVPMSSSTTHDVTTGKSTTERSDRVPSPAREP